MKFSVSLEPRSLSTPGLVQVRMQGWHADTVNLEFSVQLYQDKTYFDGRHNSWSSEEYWFKIATLKQEGSALIASIDADLLEPLLGNITATYIFKVRNASGDEQRSRLKMDINLLPSNSADAAAEQDAYEADDYTYDSPQQSAQDLSTAQTGAAKSKKLMFGVLALVVIAVLVGGLLSSKNDNTRLGALVSGADTGPCSLAQMKRQEEQAFIQHCLADLDVHNDSQAVLAVINTAKSNNHCGIAQRLYSHRAHAGDAVIALAYAQEYDPQFERGDTCFPEADSEAALYWYETVLEIDPSNSQAEQRFQELSQ